MKEKEYIGNRDQLFNIKRYMYSDGKRKNVEAIELQNSNGLDVTILVDKCLDIYQLKYKGKNLNFITPTGIVNPYFYNTIGDEWINSWEGGFLTTCGLNNIGMSCIDEDKDYGLHGKIHNTPAEQVNINVKEIEDDIICIIEGKISQSYMFGENLVIKRKYICSFRKNKLFIEDNIMNNGYKKEALMMLIS